jgi:hypothetical protein
MFPLHATFTILLYLARKETAWNRMFVVSTTAVLIAPVARFAVLEPDW